MSDLKLGTMDFNMTIIMEKCWILGCAMSVNIMPMWGIAKYVPKGARCALRANL